MILEGSHARKSTLSDGTNSSSQNPNEPFGWLSVEEWVKSTKCFWCSKGQSFAAQSGTTEATQVLAFHRDSNPSNSHHIWPWIWIVLLPGNTSIPVVVCRLHTNKWGINSSVCLWWGRKAKHTKLLYTRIKCLIYNRPCRTGETFGL